MPRPSWEQSNNPDFHGYLKFLDFQSELKDLHATFERAKKVHVSVYEIGGKKRLGGSLWMSNMANGFHLEIMDWYLVGMALGRGAAGLPIPPRYKSYSDFFHHEVNLKAFELGFITQKPGDLAVNQPKIIQS